ncbi:SrtB-anchored collagen-binding adhesin [Clostridioides difficile]|uniref:SrtB-anchored collagen-binding adhesin n=1 Tax=Clostridioides difficile TaxID=1496 RepID=UPI000944205E|nr:SrtB-anchored collagen-binding adhesin [Clostridioides difficile]EGT3686708.1 SrtB-anchored collagen-binding adhesin [Clostridioides difficile]EKG0819584.1 SrtB-anchored collagen-binding adhesin [Clostridioides difficile]MBF9946698.1 SrtB-anchored collagen-binding adhesin [Clostridioides difficile]MBH6986932.1 SrtB-anchored collagen-binding adhesin [Clostridioides difficile]MBH7141984.1 SrtB-anchored collagen-binding adhesin [Clostridioides difficile]
MKKGNRKALLISLIMILSMVVSTIYPTVSYASELGENSQIQSGSTNSSTGEEKESDNKKPEQTPEKDKATDNKKPEQTPEEEKPTDNKKPEQTPEEDKSTDNKKPEQTPEGEKPIDNKKPEQIPEEDKSTDNKKSEQALEDEKPLDNKNTEKTPEEDNLLEDENLLKVLEEELNEENEDYGFVVKINNNTIETESMKKISFNLTYTPTSKGIQAGDSITFKVPDVFNKVNLDYTSECFDKTESNGEYTLTFRELPNGQSVMQGKIGLEAYVKKVDEDTNAKIHIETTGKIESGSGDIDVEIKPGDKTDVPDAKGILKKLVEGKKSTTVFMPVKNKDINYSIQVNEKQEELKDIILYDELPEGLTLINGSVSVVTSDGKEVSDFNIEQSKNSISVNFGNIDKSYTVKYKARISDKNAKHGNKYKNVARIESDGKKIQEDDATVSIFDRGDDYLLTKGHSGATNITQVGQVINYQISINDDKSPISNVVITDNIPEGMRLTTSGEAGHDFRVVEIPMNGSWTPWSKEKIANNISYKVEEKRNESGQVDKVITGFTINLSKEEVESKFFIAYTLKVISIEDSYINRAVLDANNSEIDKNDEINFKKNSGLISAKKEVDKKVLNSSDNQIVKYKINMSTYGVYDAGQVNLLDEVNSVLEISNIKYSDNLELKKEAGDGKNTIRLVNKYEFKQIKEGEPVQSWVTFDANFTNVKVGETIRNVAQINGSSPPGVETTKQGYAFEAKKVDALDKNVLSGAKFNLEDAFGNIVVKDLVSDEDGIIQSSVKKPGTYYLVEIMAPRGYEKLKDKVKVEIGNEDIGKIVDIGNIENLKQENPPVNPPIPPDTDEPMVNPPVPPSTDKPRKPSSSSDTENTIVINPPVPPSEDIINPPIPEVLNPPVPPSEEMIETPVKQIIPIPEVVKPSVSEEKNNKVKDDTLVNPPVPPKTGDSTTIIGEILLVIGAIVGLIVLRRNKNTN